MLLKMKYLYLIFVLTLFFFGRYLYHQHLRPIYYDHKFNQAIEQAHKIPETIWDDKYENENIKNTYKVVFITNKGGEYSYAKYFQYAAEKIGWQVKIYEANVFGYEKEILSFDPDFILQTLFSQVHLSTELRTHRSKKYLVALLSLKSLRDQLEMINKEKPYKPLSFLQDHLLKTDAIITSAKEIDVFKRMYKTLEKPLFNAIRVLPTIPSFKSEPLNPKSIFWGGVGWDAFRSSAYYKKFINLIAKNIPMKVYGKLGVYSYLPISVYDGDVPGGIENIQAIRKNGIYLLTHSDAHIQSGVPSLRIFEATAANAVVISDKHPFAIEHFGDNFLYFDQTADAETMYKQVKAHYDWIKANPEKAKAMAARAHQIFLEKFTLEKDLVRIAKMHEYIVRQEKEMGLSYPLVY